MKLDRPTAQPDHEAMDDTAAWACPQPDMSCCAPEFLTPAPEAPSRRLDRIKTATLLLCVLALLVLGAVLDR